MTPTLKIDIRQKEHPQVERARASGAQVTRSHSKVTTRPPTRVSRRKGTLFLPREKRERPAPQ